MAGSNGQKIPCDDEAYKIDDLTWAEYNLIVNGLDANGDTVLTGSYETEDPEDDDLIAVKPGQDIEVFVTLL